MPHVSILSKVHALWRLGGKADKCISPLVPKAAATRCVFVHVGRILPHGVGLLLDFRAVGTAMSKANG